MIRVQRSGHDVVISSAKSALRAALSVCLVSIGAGTLIHTQLGRVLSEPSLTVGASTLLSGAALHSRWGLDNSIRKGMEALAFHPVAGPPVDFFDEKLENQGAHPVGIRVRPTARRIPRELRTAGISSSLGSTQREDEVSAEEIQSVIRQHQVRLEIYRTQESLEALQSWTWTNTMDSESLGSLGSDASHEMHWAPGLYGSTAWFVSTHLTAKNESRALVVVDQAKASRAAPARLISRPVLAAPKRTKPIPPQPNPVEYPTGVLPAIVAARQESANPMLAGVNSQDGLSALDGSAVASATTSVWSYEGWKKTSTEGWIVSAAQEQWPVLSYHSVHAENDLRVSPQFLSQREASILAATSGVRLQADAGIVFGELPAGFSAEISGRAEYPVYWRQGVGAVDTQDVAQPRWFAFVNVEPGMQVVSMVNAWSGERVPVAAAVVGGYSTHLDLRSVRRVNIHGRVVDGSARRELGRSGLSIQRVGVSGQVATTESNGGFSLPAQLVAGNLPVYLEMRSRETGYPQRIRMSVAIESSQGRIDAGSIPYLTQGQVEGWIGQIEGGISPESGMIVTAWNPTNQRVSEHGLLPMDHPMDEQPNLEPETYFLGSDDQLRVDGRVEGDLTRAVTTQVVAGLHKIELKVDLSSEGEWNELAVVSPGLISIQRTGY